MGMTLFELRQRMSSYEIGLRQTLHVMKADERSGD